MKQIPAGIASYAFFGTALGTLFIAGRDDGLLCVSTKAFSREFRSTISCTEDTEMFSREIAALQHYAEGNAGALDRLRWRSGVRGTPFQEKVWKALGTIPAGRTKTYGEIAGMVGRPGAARAVGGACHQNPLLLLVPCHRVVGAGGALTGYGEGLGLKKKLLDLEQRGRA